MTVFYICPLQLLVYCVKEKGVFLTVASAVALLCLSTNDTANGSAFQQDTVLSSTFTVTFLLLLQLA